LSVRLLYESQSPEKRTVPDQTGIVENLRNPEETGPFGNVNFFRAGEIIDWRYGIVEEGNACQESGNYRQKKYLPPMSHNKFQCLINHINT
jgi:hypothetical protein